MNPLYPRHAIVLYSLLVVITFFGGCSRNGNKGIVERVLIRVGNSTITVREFHEAFEGSITAPSILYSDPEALQEERFRTLNRLTEELIILERARELGIQVSDEELTQAVDGFKKDFPDDTFEQTLIENGISYLVWQKGLKRRLLMEKVVRNDVSEDSLPVPLPADETGTTAMNTDSEASLTAENDIHADDTAAPETPPENGPEVDEAIDETSVAAEPEGHGRAAASQTMSERNAENEYGAWLTRLKEQYTIEIDWKLWEEIEQEDSDGH